MYTKECTVIYTSRCTRNRTVVFCCVKASFLMIKARPLPLKELS